jgi:uncharacterized protein YbjT (DUF2867 family)
MANRVLVIGATGHVGAPLVKTLLAQGTSVRSASRSGQSVAGAEGVVFDLMKPDTFGPAFEGIDCAYVLAPTGTTQPKEMLMPVIEALVERRIKIVLQSVLGVDADDSIPYRQIEIALEQSASPYVILRPNWFSDNFHTFWKAGVAQGNLELPAGTGRTSFIDVRDIAESAAAALTLDRFDGQAFDLTGPRALSYGEAAEILAQVTGSPVSYTPIDDDAFIAQLCQAGVVEDYARFLASIFYPVREGWVARVTDSVTQLTGHPPRSLETYAMDHKGDLAGMALT